MHFKKEEIYMTKEQQDLLEKVNLYIYDFYRKTYPYDNGVHMEDMVQEGILACIQNIDRYDGKHKPTTFFRPYIFHAMNLWYQKNVMKTTEYLYNKKRMIEKDPSAREKCSLYVKRNLDNHDIPYEDYIKDHDMRVTTQVDDDDKRHIVKKILNLCRNEKEKQILIHRFGLKSGMPLPRRDVIKNLNITQKEYIGTMNYIKRKSKKMKLDQELH